MNFEAAASEVFQILRSYNYEVLLFDDEHNQVFEPSEARRFFAKPVNLLVSIIDNGEDSSVRLYLSRSTGVKKVLGLIQTLRNMSTKYKMVFNVREYNRDLTPKDFATQASVKESEDTSMNLVEGMYGTSRSSYLKLENARMIVRHSTRINENLLGARGRNVETIHIEDGQGQRFLMPTPQLAPARAMAHHVDNGGSWADEIGQHINRMAQDFADLGAASRHIGHYAPELDESAPAIRERVRECARAMRKTFEGLCRKTRYSDICESIKAEAETLNEGDDEAFRSRVNELAEKLNTEGVQLSERVLSTVARRVQEDEAPAQVQPVVSVLGQAVHRQAWDMLKNGQIKFAHPLTLDPNKPKLFNFREVMAATHDDTLADLMGTVLRRLHDRESRNEPGLGGIVNAALRAAGAGPTNEQEEPARMPAVREFLEWAGGHHVERLMEWDRLPQPDENHGGEEETVRHIVDNFDYNMFMASPYANEFSHDLLPRLTDEEKTFSAKQIFSAVEGYIQSEIEDAHGHSMNVDAEARTLAQQVIEYMQADGYHISVDEDVCMADRDFLSNGETLDEALTAEDIIMPRGQKEEGGQDSGLVIPKNQGQDLEGEVTKATVDDPDGGEKAPDTAYINRLQSLAGVRNKTL